ncbi:MAG: ABC transporter permease [Parvibaculaceae bacterium]
MTHRVPLSAQLSMLIVATCLLVAIFAPLIAPYGPTEIVGDIWQEGLWSAEQSGDRVLVLGADSLGRDMLTRLVYGIRTSIGLAFVIVTLSFVIGILLGFIAAIKGWLVDQILSRGVDVVLAIPTLISALAVLSILGTSIPVLIAVIAILESVQIFRIARALAMDVGAAEYVEVARLRGESTAWILFREILPNTLAPLAAEFGVRFGFVFLFVSALSFLGLGVQPPTADLGSMVRENGQGLNFGIVAPLIPAGAIAVLTIAVNLIVDWVAGRQAENRDLE